MTPPHCASLRFTGSPCPPTAHTTRSAWDQGAAHGAELAEYLQQRADLIHALAATITPDHLPDTDWAERLRDGDSDLARRLAVWRAATGATDHPHPHGLVATSTPEVRAKLRAQLRPHLTADQLSDHERWDDQDAVTGHDPADFSDQIDVDPIDIAYSQESSDTYWWSAPVNPPEGGRDRLRHSRHQAERAATRHRQPTHRGIRR